MARLIIEDINLVDDATAHGGKANSDETLAEFIQDGAEPTSYSLADINRELMACGIEPITLEQINIIGIEGE